MPQASSVRTPVLGGLIVLFIAVADVLVIALDRPGGMGSDTVAIAVFDAAVRAFLAVNSINSSRTALRALLLWLPISCIISVTLLMHRDWTSDGTYISLGFVLLAYAAMLALLIIGRAQLLTIEARFALGIVLAMSFAGVASLFLALFGASISLLLSIGIVAIFLKFHFSTDARKR